MNQSQCSHIRCKWVDLKSDLYIKYHDTEWGAATYDDETLYEMLILESFQAGLSWITILKKREDFRTAFDFFDCEKVASYGESKIEELMQNEKIIRCRRKIEAAISNSRIFLNIQKEYGSFSKYIWSFTDGKVIKNEEDAFQTTSPLSDRVSRDLKKRGMKYVGSIIIYSYLQAIGVINDHEKACFCY